MNYKEILRKQTVKTMFLGNVLRFLEKIFFMLPFLAFNVFISSIDFFKSFVYNKNTGMLKRLTESTHIFSARNSEIEQQSFQRETNGFEPNQRVPFPLCYAAGLK